MTLANLYDVAWVRHRFAASVTPGPTQEQRGDAVPGMCMLWTGSRDDDGYGLLPTKLASGVWRTLRAHRVSIMLADGVVDDRFCALHRCHTPPCVNRQHLYQGTNAQNVDDRRKAGRSASGERNGFAVLTAARAQEIRARFAAGESEQTLARAYGVNQTTINRVRRGKSWRNAEAERTT